MFRYGTVLASFLIAMGLIAQWLYPLNNAAESLGGRNLIKGGVVLFIFLPVMRVAFMLIQFAKMRDMVYAAISGVVLVIIGVGFVVGL
ncbi:DUF1634 domain-containing protein [Ochrobactrum sp. Q0168]|uniref:DUF1634 domain-containing protein n=1 Tax=Ochrobactrum sp. Q0168 TaxID=2793241 RepID=UPI0018EB9F7E|nr:DUF1634 domain-containing protein [Ochrobactrum sp. Q0168]